MSSWSGEKFKECVGEESEEEDFSGEESEGDERSPHSGYPRNFGVESDSDEDVEVFPSVGEENRSSPIFSFPGFPLEACPSLGGNSRSLPIFSVPGFPGFPGISPGNYR